ncbi:hypothetical protein [Devosia geojensis]|uniref:hypothetical protein n=1 Tax=Devosia geojensis TaxID=443610 RepID=UPI00128E9555|nr:hypothetical protein [Devosia geojensis]
MDWYEELELKRAIRRLTMEFRMEAAAIRVRVALRRLVDWAEKGGFDPNQPRVPAGSSDGGQWTRAGSSEVDRIISIAQKLTFQAGPLSYDECLDLCYPLLERPQPRWSDRNMWDFHACMKICQGK